MSTKGRRQLKALRPFALAALAALFAWLTLATRELSGAEQELLRWIYDMPDSLRGFALVVTQGGSFWLFIGLIGLLFVTRWKPKAAVDVLRAGILGYVLVFLTKLVVARPRPDVLLEGVVSRELFTFGQGFPSGHVTIATIMSLVLLSYLPKSWRWIVPVWILLVAWSRIYLGVHTPLDVLGGFILGLIVVLGVAYLPKSLRA